MLGLDWLAKALKNEIPKPAAVEQAPDTHHEDISKKDPAKLTKAEKQDLLDKQNESVFLKWLTDGTACSIYFHY